MQNALEDQVGGQHYKALAYEPFEIAYPNQYDPLIFSCVKYLMRHRGKDGAEGLHKGAHCAFIREELSRTFYLPSPGVTTVSPENVAAANKMTPEETDLLVTLHRWSIRALPGSEADIAADVASKFHTIRKMEYPSKGKS